MSARTGANEAINGVYVPMPNKQFSNMSVFKHKTQELYMYYHTKNGAWLIGKNLGDASAPAYLACEPKPPHLAQVAAQTSLL